MCLESCNDFDCPGRLWSLRFPLNAYITPAAPDIVSLFMVLAAQTFCDVPLSDRCFRGLNILTANSNIIHTLLIYCGSNAFFFTDDSANSNQNWVMPKKAFFINTLQMTEEILRQLGLNMLNTFIKYAL